jgi:hypothetical protein
MLMGQIKSTTNMLNPMGGSATENKKEHSPEKIPNNTNREYHSDEEIEKDEDLSNVSLSSRDELDDEMDQKHKGKNFLDHFKMSGGSTENSEDSPKEGILGQIKATTLSAGSAVITTTESAGAVIVGGLKATTQLLNPMNLVKPKEDPVDQKKVDEEFANIHIEEEAPAPPPAPEEKPKVGFFEQLKQKTGLAPAAPAEEQPQKYDPHSHTFPTPVVSHKPRFTHHDQHDAHHTEKPKDPPKESFLDQIKSRTGFAKDDDIAHDSAPKEGFLSSINPFGGSAEPAPARKPVIPPARRTSTTTTSSSSSSSSTAGGGITGMFDSLTGKSESAKRPEPAKQASFMDHLTGKTQPPKKEPSFFDSLTGNSSTTSSKSEGSFW